MKTKKKFFVMLVAILTLAIAAFCFAGCFSDDASESTVNDSVTSEQPSSSELDSTDSTSGDSETGDSGSSEQPVKKQFNVTAPAASDKYTFEGEDKATEGETYTFTVEKAAGVHGTLTVTATMGGHDATVENTDDGYEIAAVNGDIVITVTYADKLVSVTKTLCDGVTLVGEEKAIVGNDYKFKVEFEEGYTEADDFEVKVNGVAVEADGDGYYTVEAVKTGFVIEVSGAKTITYGVTYVVDGVEADAIDKTTDEILYTNEKYTIDFTVSEKYSKSTDDVKVFVKIGGGEEQEVLPTDGAYVITNPKADITVIVKGLKINTYKVNFVVNGDVFCCFEKVEHGTVVGDEMLEEAAGELAEQGLYEVIGWGEIPAAITGYTFIEAKVSAKSIVSDRALDVGECTGLTVGGGTVGNWSNEADIAAPDGFKTVKKMTSGFNDNGKKYLHGRFLHADVTNYSMITFALKSNGTFSYDTTVGGDARTGSYSDWLVYTLTNNGGIWHINVKCGDEVLSDFNDSAARTNICDILWHGRAVGFNVTAPDDGDFEVYSTEVRGVVDVDKIGESVVEKVIVDATETTDTVLGFGKAYHYKPQGTPADKDGNQVKAQVAETDITAYNHLEFYVKVTSSWILFDEWTHYFASNGQWVKVEANKIGEQEWVVEFKGGAGESTTVNNVTTLDQLLTFKMDRRDSSLEGATVEGCSPSEITITEIRGKKGPVPSAPQGERISGNVYGSIEGASIATVKTGETAPAGFENVYYYKSEPKAAGSVAFVHGMFFSRADITEYSTVSFAMKTNCKYQLDDPNRVTLGNDWIIFKLEQAQDGRTWTLTLTNAEGEVVHSAEKLMGTNVHEILWSNRTTSYCPINDEETGVSLKVWTTDVRGVLKTAE